MKTRLKYSEYVKKTDEKELGDEKDIGEKLEGIEESIERSAEEKTDEEKSKKDKEWIKNTKIQANKFTYAVWQEQ